MKKSEEHDEVTIKNLEIEFKKTKWVHRNGVEYQVLMFTNIYSQNKNYPVNVVYQGNNGKIWSRKLTDWSRSMFKMK